jgi:peptide/nickel transport system permease protein
VADLVGSRVVNSMALLMFAALIGIPTGILLGAYSAVRRDTRFDELALLAAFGLAALPEFVVGMVLVIVFATTVFQVLPGVALIPSGETPFSHLDALVLPVATLALAVIPYLFRLVRASMIDVLESDYVQMARLKGMPERNVLLRHALPNALVPAIQASALVLAYLAGGIAVVEFLFAYPGLGSGLTDAIANRDLPMIQVSVLILATGVVIFNLVADLLTIYMTPRLRTSGS